MGDLLLALQSTRRTLSDRVHSVSVALSKQSDGVSMPYTEKGLLEDKAALAEAEVAIEAVKIHRKGASLAGPRSDTFFKVSDLRDLLSLPADQDKPVWAYLEQSAAYEHIVGISREKYNGRHTFNLLINVPPEGKKKR